MKKVQLERTFNATAELLWELIVDCDHYHYWTEAFSVGSDFIGDWTKGSNIRFVVEDEEGLQSGMLSEVIESTWPKSISIRHIGLVMKGVEDYNSAYAKEWTPAFENYRLIKTSEDTCTFELEQDIPENELDDFIISWVKAFDRMETYLETSENLGKVIALKEVSSQSPEIIWQRLVIPKEIMAWNYASEDWHCPDAKIDLRVGGEFHYEMAAKDGSLSFDFWGTFTEIVAEKLLAFELGDGRKVRIDLIEKPYGCIIEERFEVEQENSLHLQRSGWQSILKNLAR